MKPQEKIAIDNLRMEGVGPGDIAQRLHLSPNTVRSHIRRHPAIPDTALCADCGKPLVQPPGRKAKKFCSDACRMHWWNTHPESIHKKAYYTLTCNQCGKEFQSYGNSRRQFCCRDCYIRSRQRLQPGESAALPHDAGAAGEADAGRPDESA